MLRKTSKTIGPAGRITWTAPRGRCPRCGRDVALSVETGSTRNHLHATPYRDADVYVDRRGRAWCKGGRPVGG